MPAIRTVHTSSSTVHVNAPALAVDAQAKRRRARTAVYESTIDFSSDSCATDTPDGRSDLTSRYSSPATSTPPSAPSPASTISSVASPTQASKKAKKVPRPPNAFIVFRKHMVSQNLISTAVERDQRHISQIAAHCWRSISPEERAHWKRRALEEAREHALKYPGYHFRPAPRVTPTAKRNVVRNTDADRARSKEIAALLTAGLKGDELEKAAYERRLDVMTALTAANALPPAQSGEARKKKKSSTRKGLMPMPEGPGDHVALSSSMSPAPGPSITRKDEPAFMSPLLKPRELTPLPETQPSAEVLVAQPPAVVSHYSS
jgi:hypothetical protein